MTRLTDPLKNNASDSSPRIPRDPYALAHHDQELAKKCASIKLYGKHQPIRRKNRPRICMHCGWVPIVEGDRYETYLAAVEFTTRNYRQVSLSSQVPWTSEVRSMREVYGEPPSPGHLAFQRKGWKWQRGFRETIQRSRKYPSQGIRHQAILYKAVGERSTFDNYVLNGLLVKMGNPTRRLRTRVFGGKQTRRVALLSRQQDKLNRMAGDSCGKVLSTLPREEDRPFVIHALLIAWIWMKDVLTHAGRLPTEGEIQRAMTASLYYFKRFFTQAQVCQVFNVDPKTLRVWYDALRRHDDRSSLGLRSLLNLFWIYRTAKREVPDSILEPTYGYLAASKLARQVIRRGPAPGLDEVLAELPSKHREVVRGLVRQGWARKGHLPPT